MVAGIWVIARTPQFQQSSNLYGPKQSLDENSLRTTPGKEQGTRGFLSYSFFYEEDSSNQEIASAINCVKTVEIVGASQ